MHACRSGGMFCDGPQHKSTRFVMMGSELYVFTSICTAFKNDNLYFRAKIRNILYTPVNPSFTIKKWGGKDLNYTGVFA